MKTKIMHNDKRSIEELLEEFKRISPRPESSILPTLGRYGLGGLELDIQEITKINKTNTP